MDDFGIGGAIQAAYRTLLQALRQTGRTTRTIESLQPGDRMVFCTQEDAMHFSRALKQRRPDFVLDYHIVNPRDPHSIFNMPRGTPKGRMRFDHRWVEQYYEHAIQAAVEQVRFLQDQTSGRGEPHLRTEEEARYLKDRFYGGRWP